CFGRLTNASAPCSKSWCCFSCHHRCWEIPWCNCCDKSNWFFCYLYSFVICMCRNQSTVSALCFFCIPVNKTSCIIHFPSRFSKWVTIFLRHNFFNRFFMFLYLCRPGLYKFGSFLCIFFILFFKFFLSFFYFFFIHFLFF